jgi:hypothetical protein
MEHFLTFAGNMLLGLAANDGSTKRRSRDSDEERPKKKHRRSEKKKHRDGHKSNRKGDCTKKRRKRAPSSESSSESSESSSSDSDNDDANCDAPKCTERDLASFIQSRNTELDVQGHTRCEKCKRKFENRHIVMGLFGTFCRPCHTRINNGLRR